MKAGGKAPPVPLKRQREPTPSESESEASMSDAASEEGQPIPSLDVALLVTLREKEIASSLVALQKHCGSYRKLFVQLAEWKATFILEQIQPAVSEELQKQKFFTGSKTDPSLAFYNVALSNSCRMGERSNQKTHMKVTSIGMRNSQVEAAASPKKGLVVVPFTVDDIVPIIRCDDGDEMFLSWTTAVTVSYLVDEEAIKASGMEEPFHAVQYEFHFASDALVGSLKKPFSNKSLRVRFFTQGGMFYRQAMFAPGRIVDIHTDAVQWANDDARNAFEGASSPFSMFRVLFSGLYPKIQAGSAFAVPKGHIAIRNVLEKHIGSLAAVPPKEMALVDVELLQRLFAPFEETGIALPPLNPRKDKKKLQEDEDDDMDPALMASRLSEYMTVTRTLGEKASSGGALSQSEELDIVRRIVLANVPLHYFADSILNIVATGPLEVALMAQSDDDEEEDEEEDGEEGDEEEEGEEEETGKEAQSKPPAANKGKQPDCKQQ